MARQLIRGLRGRSDERSMSLQDYADSYFKFGNLAYALNMTYGANPSQEVPASYVGFVEQAYRSNPVIFACMQRRMSLFSEARFKYRQIRNGKPGDLFGTQDLSVLERPWPNGTTTDLLARAIQDVDIAGNFYAYRANNRIYRLRPDWVTIILGSQLEEAAEAGYAYDVEVVGYSYRPPNGEWYNLLPEQVCHWAPTPDPLAAFRGVSWMQSLIRETTAHGAMTDHQLAYFRNGATPNLVVSLDPQINQTAFERWISTFRANNEGVANAYKTMYLAGGANAQVVGSRMEDFKTVKGHSETLICMAAGVPSVIAGSSEGLEGSSLNAGNFNAARRLFADGTMRPLWRSLAQSISNIVQIPSASELWYDVSDIPFLAEDEQDAAAILAKNSDITHTLIAAGFEPDSVINAVTAGDLSRLIHSGLYSVQLQPAGSLALGKGSVVQGVPTSTKPAPKQLPAATAQNAAPVFDLLDRIRSQETA